MLNKNVFNVSDPSKMLDALWGEIVQYKNDFSRVLIFLPSNRAIRSVEKMIVQKIKHHKKENCKNILQNLQKCYIM